jgi:hypothetical protein
MNLLYMYFMGDTLQAILEILKSNQSNSTEVISNINEFYESA